MIPLDLQESTMSLDRATILAKLSALREEALVCTSPRRGLVIQKEVDAYRRDLGLRPGDPIPKT